MHLDALHPVKANQCLVLVESGPVGSRLDGWMRFLQKFSSESLYPLRYRAPADEEGSEGPEGVKQAGFS